VANYGLCVVSMLCSVVLGLAGIYFMTKKGGEWQFTSRPALAGQSLLFLVTQSFTLSKVSRDFLSVREDNIARPTLAYYFQVLFFWVIALVSSIYSAATISDIKEWTSFYMLDLVWVTVSAICLSKAVRDRSEADAFEKVGESLRPMALLEMAPIIRGTCMYKVFVWISCLGSTVLMMILMWTWPKSSLSTERKLLLTVGDLWCLISVFHVAKLVRDNADRAKAKQLKKQVAFQVMIWASMLGSSAVVIGAIAMMPLELPQKFFMICGTLCMLSTAFFLAKAVRDKQEIDVLEIGEEESGDEYE